MTQQSNYCETVREGVSLEEVSAILETIKDRIVSRKESSELRMVGVTIEMTGDNAATVTLRRNLTHAEWLCLADGIGVPIASSA